MGLLFASHCLCLHLPRPRNFGLCYLPIAQAGQRISTPEGTAVAVYQSTGAPGQMQSRPEIEKPALKQGAQDVGLFVLGGASTVCEGPVKMPSMDDFAGHVAATHVALDMPEVAVELEPANKQPALAPVVRASLVPRSDCLTDDSSGKSNGGKLRGCFNGFITSCKVGLRPTRPARSLDTAYPTAQG